MNSEQIASLVEGCIPLFAGIYATLLGHRVLGKKVGKDLKYDKFMEEKGIFYKVLGPLLIAFGLFTMAKGIL